MAHSLVIAALESRSYCFLLYSFTIFCVISVAFVVVGDDEGDNVDGGVLSVDGGVLSVDLWCVICCGVLAVELWCFVC